MKKLAVFLSIVLMILAVKTQNAFSEADFYDELTSEILEEINTFRTHPLSYVDSLGIKTEQIQSIWGERGVAYLSSGLSLLSLDQSLTIAAKAHLEDMFNNIYISHLSQDGLQPEERATQSGYNALLIGESIAFLCFENYISPAQAADILLRQFFKDALLQQTAEGAPLVFAPYENSGIALGSSTFKIEGKLYNVYGMCILFGVNKNTLQKLIVGRIYVEKLYQPLSNIKVTLKKGDDIYNTITFLDGSYFFLISSLSGEAVLKIEWPMLNLSPYFEIGQKRINLNENKIKQDFILPAGVVNFRGD